MAVSDEPQWQRLWASYQSFYRVALPLEVTQSTWRRFFDDTVPINALGAFDGDELCGIVHYVFQDSTWSVERVCYLRDLFVAPSVRKQGIARRLIHSVYAVAEATGSHRTYWLTQEKNRVARGLSDSVASCPGFVLYEHRRDPLEPTGSP